MARTWIVNQSDCSKINLLHGSDDDDTIWLENTWHEVSPTQAATLPSGTKMLDANDKELTLVDGYCTTYFYKGWQTVIPLTNNASGNIIYQANNMPQISKNVGDQVFDVGIVSGDSGYLVDTYLQVVRLFDQNISLPDNLGNKLIPDLYTGYKWIGSEKNWVGKFPPLVPDLGRITMQKVSFPRTFIIDETRIPGYGTDTNNKFYAPELFWPYMYLLRRKNLPNGSYIGGLIVVIGVKKLS